jgi:hypothetical protein
VSVGNEKLLFGERVHDIGNAAFTLDFPQAVGNYVGNLEKPPIYRRFESFPHFYKLPTLWGLSDNFGFI